MEDISLEKQDPTGGILENDPVTPTNSTEYEEENYLLEEVKACEESQESQVLVDKLKQSTFKLTSAIGAVAADVDLKLDRKISSTAHNVDQTLGVSKIVSGTMQTLNHLWSEQVKPATRNIVESDRVKGVKSLVEGTLEKTGVTTTIKSIEKEHQITKKAVNVVATSMDWISDTLSTTTSSRRDDGSDGTSD